MEKISKIPWHVMLKKYLSIVLPLTILIGSATALIHYKEYASQQQAIEIIETNIVALAEKRLASTFEPITSDLLLLSGSTHLAELLEKGGDASRETLEKDFLSFACAKRVYDQIRFIDAAGMEIIRVNYNNGKPGTVSGKGLQHKGDRYYFRETIRLGQGEVYVSPLDLNIEHGMIEEPLKPMIRFSMPVFDRKGEKRGIVIINYLAVNMLDKLSALTSGQSSELMLLDPEGYWLKGPKPEDEWGFMYSDRIDRNFPHRFPVAWKRMSSKTSGQFSDRNGLFTFRNIYPLSQAQRSAAGLPMTFASGSGQPEPSGYYWKIAARVPQEYMSSVSDRILREHLLLNVIIGIILLTVSWFMAKAMVRRKMAEEALSKSREELEGTVRERTTQFYENIIKLEEEVAERKRAKEALEQMNDLLKSLNNIQSQFISETPAHTLFDGILTNLISLTRSEYGFIGEVLYAEDNKPYIKTHSLTNIAWNRETKELYDKNAATGMEFRNLNNLCGAVLVSRKPVISNDPSTDPRRGGLPEGHPPLKAFLGLPIIKGDKLEGIIGMANRPGGYSEEVVEYLHPLISTCANIIEAYRNDTLRKDAEAALRVHARELTALVESSGMISSIPPGKNLLEAICMVSIKKFGVKEAWVCLTDNKGSDIRPASCLGFGPDLITGPKAEGNGPSCCVNPANTAVKTRTAQVMHDIQNDPECGHMTEEALKNGHRSLMAIPLIDSENRAIGALCLYSGEPGYFSDKRINLLQIFANYVSIAIENRRLIEGLEDKVIERTAELEDFGHRLHKLYELSFASRTSAREFANMILHELGGLLNVDGAALGIFEHNTWVGYAVTDRAGLGLTEGMTFPADEVFCKIVSDSRRPLVIKDASVSAEYREHPDFIKYGFSSYLGVPVFIEENMFGVLCTFSRSPYDYREHDLILHQLISKRLEFEFIREKYINDIRDAMVQAESASRAKSDFLANMSHELRTPLNSIIGFSEMMFDGMTGPITEKQRDFLDTVISSGRHLLALINDILDLSKIEAGKMDLELNEFDLKRFLESCLEMFRKKIIKHNIKTGVSLEEGIGTITADERKIKQVVFNLVSNALKFTSDGGSVSISARIVRNAAAPEGPADAAAFNEIEVIVEDTGIGISAEGIKRLFRPFEQLENAYIKKYEGTGLGLALCKKIIELHGGSILVKSEPGKGSAFSFVLPVRTKNLTITDRLLAVRETVNPVTHLLTWEYFLRHMERVSSLHSRAGKRFGLLYFETDSGVRSEDIIAVAGLLKKTIRKHEIVSHGRNPKSFCVILFNADRAMIGNALSRIDESLQQGGYTFNIKSALFMEDGETIEEMLKAVEKDRK